MEQDLEEITINNTLWLKIKVVANSVGVSDNTYYQWRSANRGFVPPSMHHELVVEAAHLGVELTHKELHEQWKTAKQKR